MDKVRVRTVAPPERRKLHRLKRQLTNQVNSSRARIRAVHATPADLCSGKRNKANQFFRYPTVETALTKALAIQTYVWKVGATQTGLFCGDPYVVNLNGRKSPGASFKNRHVRGASDEFAA